MEGERVTQSVWLMVGAIDRPRNHTRDANMRKLQRACLRWGYQWTALVSKDRHRDKVEARQIMMKYLREQGWAYSEIGAILGGRDHATAIYGVKQATHLLDYDRHFRAKYYEFLNA